MKIRDILHHEQFSLSFEVFPPKREGNIEKLYNVIKKLISLNPHFISVTYGAGGSTREKTVEISSTIKNTLKVEVLAHLTCVQSTQRDISRIIDEFKKHNIENILSLRGDPPKGEELFIKPEGGFGHANELVAFIRKHNNFSIGVAAYPEKHIDAPSIEIDIANLKRKVDAGADFILTQLFFDNDCFYTFRDRIIAAGITIPTIPSIFPIFNYTQIERMTSLCGATIPQKLKDKLNKVHEKNEEVEKYGIDYAIAQCENLLKNGIPGLHFCSMNKSSHVIQIVNELSLPMYKPSNR